MQLLLNQQRCEVRGAAHLPLPVQETLQQQVDQNWNLWDACDSSQKAAKRARETIRSAEQILTRVEQQRDTLLNKLRLIEIKVEAAKQSLSDAQSLESTAESNAKIAKSRSEDSESEIAFLFEKSIGSFTSPSYAHHTSRICKSDRTTAMSQLLILFPDLSNMAIDSALARARTDKTQACRQVE